jgi:hypothetical protein
MIRIPESDLMSKEPLIQEAPATPANSEIATPMGVQDIAVVADSIPDLPMGGFTNGIRKPKQAAGLGEALSTAWELNSMDRLMSNVNSYWETSALKKEGVDLDIDTLKIDYPDYNWTEPTTKAAAEYIYRDFQSAQEKRAIIANADVGTVGRGLVWATGILSTMADPVTIATFVAGGLATKAATTALGVASNATKIGLAVAENVATGAVLEAATAAEASAMQKDYTAGDFAVNAVGMGIAGTLGFEGLTLAFKGLGMGVKQGLKTMNKYSDMGLRALDAGVSPGATLDKMLSEVTKIDGNLKQAFTTSIKDLFPENATKYLDATPLETMELIGRDFADGKIPEEKFMDFMTEMKTKGFEEEYLKNLQDTGSITQEVLDNTKKFTEDPMSKIGADPIAENMKVLTPEEVDGSVSKMKRDADTALAELSKTEDPVLGEIVNDAKELAVKEDALAQGAKIYTDCMRTGGAK